MASVLVVFAVIDFLVGGIGLLSGAAGLASETGGGSGLIVAAIGFSGGFALLAFAKVINCLHESAYRLRNIQKLLEK
jgi:hypothetical protein